ncbi:MAG: aminotransferase class I/II-fold pyridoxal phosphate-dependent enzyme [Gammaproteobacteria bacterium]|nr:aminotransferase class I/II-fold pyridoxal phosphate-dependent enzyme [Gammaproteobacteria bacterium]
MLPKQFPSRVQRSHQSMQPIYEFLAKYETWCAEAGDNGCDFALGNPQSMPLPGFVTALKKSAEPQNKDWYAYKMNEPSSRNIVAESLRQQFERPYAPEDIFMTNGATGAVMVVLNTLIGNGDEVVFNSPPWFFYEGMVLNSGGIPVRVKVQPSTFDLDLEAIAKVINEKTSLVIVNSPNNPTGKVYSPETLKGLATVLTEASDRYDRPIYLLSDEAYRKIIFNGAAYPSPTSYYPNSVMIYTYGKALLTPGQRVGYIALSPELDGRDSMRSALLSSQILCGWAMTSALMQHSLGDLEALSIDVQDLQRKRDWLVTTLRDIGYDVHSPEGTFYLTPRAPIDDDSAFIDLLAKEGVFCLPGSVVEMPGYFRMTLAATDSMIERAIPKLAMVRKRLCS